MAQHALSRFESGGPFERGWSANPFLLLHREMNRLFDDVVRGGGHGGLLPGADALVPQLNVSETENEIRVTAELPGVSEKAIEVRLEDDILTIRGEKKIEHKDEKENYHVVERAFGAFQRSLRLPFRINPDQVQARFENGVLTVTLPKPQDQEHSRRIEVRSGAAQNGGGQEDTSASGERGKAADKRAS